MLPLTLLDTISWWHEHKEAIGLGCRTEYQGDANAEGSHHLISIDGFGRLGCLQRWSRHSDGEPAWVHGLLSDESVLDSIRDDGRRDPGDRHGRKLA